MKVLCNNNGMKEIGDIVKSAKAKYTKRPRYTVVLHDVREKLRLSMNDYVVIDSIHKLSHNDPKYHYCIMSKENLAEFLRIARRTVFNIIQTGLEKGLLEKNDRGDLRTTDKWVNLIELYDLKARN